jgi:hypothetical protein
MRPSMPKPEGAPPSVAQEMREILFEIAPDRAEELETVMRELKVRLTAAELQHESPFVAVPGKAEIRAHMPALKRQLVMALAYVMAYRSAEQDVNTSIKRVYMPDSLRAKEAREMLRWAMLERYLVARASEQGEPPPNESVPWHWFPLHGAPRGSDDRIATGMFYTAMAADLHHELAHLAKGHGTRTWSKRSGKRRRPTRRPRVGWWVTGPRTTHSSWGVCSA